MNKIKKIFQSTLAKVISIVLIMLFALSLFFYFDFYKRQIYKVEGYYLVYKGDKAFKKKDLSKAVYYYEKGIKYHPEHFRAMYNLANIYVVYEDYYSALKNYEKALKIRPDYEVARIDYAIILSEIYKTDEAIKQYMEVIENQPKFIKIPFIIDKKKSYKHNRGVAYYNMGRAYRTKSLLAGLNDISRDAYLDKASKSYEEAIKILKTYNANYNLGLIHQLLKNNNQAGYYYCKAMEIEPMEYEAHFNLALILKDMEEYKGAAEEFKKAGIILNMKGDYEKNWYIFDILSEVNQKIALSNDKEYFKKIREQEENKHSVYKAGKLVLKESKEDEKEFINSFKTCENKEFFMGDM